jgi:hypothetical protein
MITPEDLEHALEVLKRLDRRLKINEETFERYYEPLLTDEELYEGLDALETLRFVQECPRYTYKRPGKPKHEDWTRALQQLKDYMAPTRIQIGSSELYTWSEMNRRTREKWQNHTPAQAVQNDWTGHFAHRSSHRKQI